MGLPLITDGETNPQIIHQDSSTNLNTHVSIQITKHVVLVLAHSSSTASWWGGAATSLFVREHHDERAALGLDVVREEVAGGSARARARIAQPRRSHARSLGQAGQAICDILCAGSYDFSSRRAHRTTPLGGDDSPLWW